MHVPKIIAHEMKKIEIANAYTVYPRDLVKIRHILKSNQLNFTKILFGTNHIHYYNFTIVRHPDDLKIQFHFAATHSVEHKNDHHHLPRFC